MTTETGLQFVRPDNRPFEMIRVGGHQLLDVAGLGAGQLRRRLRRGRARREPEAEPHCEVPGLGVPLYQFQRRHMTEQAEIEGLDVPPEIVLRGRRFVFRRGRSAHFSSQTASNPA